MAFGRIDIFVSNLKLKVVHIVFVVTLFSSLNSFAQFPENISFGAMAKSHSFYDSGVYEIGNTSLATTRGFGISANYKLGSHSSLTLGYGFARINGLDYEMGTIDNAAFHQFDLNVNYHFRKPQKSLRPYAFFGYSLNSIPKLEDLNEPTSGMNSNFGVGLHYQMKNKLGILYNTTYAFSFTEHIRFNFRHQLGITYTPNFKEPKVIYSDDIVVDSYNQENSDSLDFYRSEVDSLQQVIASLRVAKTNTGKETNGLLASYNADLVKKIRFMEMENQRLLTELRANRANLDSIVNEHIGLYKFVDSLGEEYIMDDSKFTHGIYLVQSGVDSLPDAFRIEGTAPFNSFENSYVLKQEVDGETEYVVIGLISTNAEESQKKLAMLNGETSIFELKYL